jgi:hypothetical protein
MTSADPHRTDDRRGGIVRRVLSPGPNPEERLEELLAARRRELDEHAARLHESIAELERREELLRDSRASVERMLRLGTTDLEAREAELTGYLRDLTERETMIARAEDDLARRRQELGAVELKRAALEARERALDVREVELSAREEGLPLATGSVTGPATVALAFVPGTRYAVVELEPVELDPGSKLDVDGDSFVVARIGRSPFPGDQRRCAYLVRGGRDERFSGSS